METTSAWLPFVRGIYAAIDGDDDFKMNNTSMN